MILENVCMDVCMYVCVRACACVCVCVLCVCFYRFISGSTRKILTG